MTVSALTLKDLNSPFLNYIQGSLSAIGSQALPSEVAKTDCLTFVSSENQLLAAIENKAAIVIVDSCLKDFLHKSKESLPPNSAFFLTPTVAFAFSIILPFFDKKKTKFSKGIHPTAIISPTALIGKDACIGPYSIIGDFVVIGTRVLIGPHVIIERATKIGDDCIFHANILIGADSEIGDQCEVHPFTCIGSDGFGFVKNPEKGSENKHKKIPQVGRVVIEAEVEIGSHCAIDRATLYETRIKKGAKLDNHCHIAHNCTIGENTVLAAGFMVAGSTKIGANCMAGGMVGISDHITIGDGVHLAGRAAVIQNITEPGAYIGYPAMPLKKGLKNLSAFTNLDEMRRDLSKIQKHLNLKVDKQKG